MSPTRDQILSRIDAALGSARGNPTNEWESLPRDYIRRDSLTGPALIELFVHRITDYGAEVFKTKPADIRQTIDSILIHRNARRMLIPPRLPGEYLPSNFSFVEDAGLGHRELNGFDGVVTTASVAIAATGTIVLQHGPGQGRRALTLIPDYHVCVVRTDQIVETVPTAFARLDPLLPTTFISGPSATADIEMTRIKGVHGPRFMDVVLIA